jgi:DNA-binding transcriptional ArsR family regulator
MADPARDLADIDAVFTALAHPARRQILLTIHYWGGTMTAGEIANRFEHSWPTTTRHLQVLEDAGLLTHERVGRARRYTLARLRLNVVRGWVAHFDSDAQSTRKTRTRSA